MTPDRRKSETEKETWESVSFLDLACVFRGVLDELKGQPGFHFLRYYLAGLLKDVCRASIPPKDADSCEDPYAVLDYLVQLQSYLKKGVPDGNAR